MQGPAKNKNFMEEFRKAVALEKINRVKPQSPNGPVQDRDEDLSHVNEKEDESMEHHDDKQGSVLQEADEMEFADDYCK